MLCFFLLVTRYQQESRRAYGTAVSGVVIYLKKTHLNRSQRGQLVQHVFMHLSHLHGVHWHIRGAPPPI